MFTFVCATLFTLFSMQDASNPVALPDTPQGQHVQAFIKAFNSGDEKTFLAVQHEHSAPRSAKEKEMSDAERVAMYKRMKGDFGTFQVQKVIKSTAQEIRLLVPMQDGTPATFTFNFEEKAPFRIIGINVDVRDR